MFTFSIREMIAWTLALALIAAWVVEHRRLNAANASLRRLEDVESDYQMVVRQIEDEGFVVVKRCSLGLPLVTKPFILKEAIAAVEAEKTTEQSPHKK